MRISDWSSDVCSSDLDLTKPQRREKPLQFHVRRAIFIGFKKPTDFPVGPHVPTYHDSHDTDAMLQSRQGPMRHTGKKSIVGRIEGTQQIIFLLSPAKADRSEERGVGKESVSTGRSRW